MQSRFEDIADIVLKASTADQTEVVALGQEESLTRFANNHIHQNVTERNWLISVRAVVGTRVAIVASNDTRPESLKALAGRALELARLQPENPDFKGLPKPSAGEPETTAGFDPAVAACSPDVRADRVGILCRKAKAVGYTAAGSMTTATYDIGVANSLGIFAHCQSTLADGSAVVMSPTSSGWAQASGWHLDALKWEALADEAIRKTKLGENPRDLNPGTYTVILDPYATADIVDWLGMGGASAQAVQEERSWINGRIGQQVMASAVSIVDDARDPLGIPMPFDFEGVPKQVVPIVEQGVLKGPVYDSYTAGREPGKQSTGHATPPSPTERYGPLPLNLFLRPGTSNVDEMIRSTKLGVYVTRFWYTRMVQPREVVVTGMTRDGTFVIRNGEIAHAAKSLRFTQSYLGALLHVESIGSTLKTLRSGPGATTVPAVMLGEFRFTSATR